MLTLQILDGGETFFRPLGGLGLTIGSGEGCDVRLTEPGVAPRHARIEPLGPAGAAAPERYKIVDLDSAGGTTVNGQLVAQWLLKLGDRIEIGGAVLVVGQRVQRRATPEDVLDDVVVRTGGSPGLLRAAPGRAPARRTVSRLFLWSLVGGAVVFLGVLVWSRSHDVLPVRWADIASMRQDARFDDARALIATLRRDWAAGDSQRAARLDQAEAQVDAVDEALRAGRIRIRREAAVRGRLAQLEELQQLRATSDSPDGEAAVILLSELTELRLGVSRAPDPAMAVAAGAAQERPGSAAAATTPASPRPAPDGAAEHESGGAEASRFVRERLSAVERVRGQGLYAQALEMLNQALEDTEAAVAAPLRQCMADLRGQIDTELRTLVGTAKAAAETGELPDVDRAIATLEREARRFPSGGEFGFLADQLDALRLLRDRLGRAAQRSDAAGSPPRGRRLAELGDVLAEAEAADRAGEYRGAAEAYRLAAERLRADDPQFARELDGRRADLELLAELAAYDAPPVAVAEPGPVVMPSSEGGAARRAARGAGPAGQPVDWSSGASVDRLTEAGAPGRVLVGAAVLAYRRGDTEAAEAILRRAVQRTPELQELCNGVIARGRGEQCDARGYRLVKGEFVAVRSIEAQQRAGELGKRLGRIAQKSERERGAVLEDILSAGPKELDALVIALREQVRTVAKRIDSHAFKRHHDKLLKLRLELDRARDDARELIFDERTYFYPYKPPAVSAERASEYWKVQGEVDERVERVRKLWEAKSPKRSVPPRLVEDLRHLDWLLGVLDGFGEHDPRIRDQVAWARSLPASGELELRNFCVDERERQELEIRARIDEYNGLMAPDMSRAEIALVAITNQYREMFGHRPLAVSRKLIDATRGHAREMSRLGYFSHFSPVPGRATPYERMLGAGYAMGVSENIADHPSAISAHQAWLHSSGHHRNLLMPSHREFGCGNDGRYWVQNFGRGDEYEMDRDFGAGK